MKKSEAGNAKTTGARHEHPEDRAARLEGERYGAAHANEFCKAHASKMEELIRTYSDGEAARLLDRMRERFWAQEWKPARPDTARTPSGGSLPGQQPPEPPHGE